jgi:hypothetical protein
MYFDWVRIVELCFSILSMSGCLFVVVVFLCYKKLRSFQFECVTYLTISSLMTAFSYVLFFIGKDTDGTIIYPTDGDIKSMDICKAQAFLMVWFENSQFFWATLIGYSIYQNVIHFEENKLKTTWQKRTKFIAVGYALPLCLAIIGLIIPGTYGPSGFWCWIDAEGHLTLNTVFSLFLYFMVWFLILANFILNCYVIRFLNKEMSSPQERDLAKKYIYKLLQYPIIQVVCLIPGSLSRTWQLFFDKPIFWLEVCHLIFVNIAGLCYAVAYGYTPQVKTTLYENLKCCKNNKVGDTPSSPHSENNSNYSKVSELNMSSRTEPLVDSI